MNRGEIHAWHYAARRPVQLRWDAGKIVSITPTEQSPPTNVWLAPTLVDLQINGFAGVDFQQDNLTLEELLHATRELRRHGCAKWLLTLITDAWPRLIARLRQLRDLRARSPELQQAIPGFHVEGPFLSAEPGFCGAHDPALMIDPTPAHIRELRELLPGLALLLTLAPERPGALDAIREARSLGIIVSLGHTNATTSQLADAVAHGASAFTHLGNACPQQLDRHDNILWRVLNQPALTVSLIPDGIHVSPDFFRLVHRSPDSDRIYYTTDAMSAAGAPPGRHRLGAVELKVGADGIVRQPGKTNFAGAALTPLQGVMKAAEMLGEDWQTAWARFSETPAKFIGHCNATETLLAPGRAADFCLLHFDSDEASVSQLNKHRSLQIVVDGERE